MQQYLFIKCHYISDIKCVLYIDDGAEPAWPLEAARESIVRLKKGSEPREHSWGFVAVPLEENAGLKAPHPLCRCSLYRAHIIERIQLSLTLPYR